MCLWAVRHIQFEKLSGTQKTGLKQQLQARKKEVQSRLADINKALKHVAKHSKRKSPQRRGG
jgi:hypothetical protein